MMNIDLIFPEIYLSLSIMFLLMIGVFKKIVRIWFIIYQQLH